MSVGTESKKLQIILGRMTPDGMETSWIAGRVGENEINGFDAGGD